MRETCPSCLKQDHITILCPELQAFWVSKLSLDAGLLLFACCGGMGLILGMLCNLIKMFLFVFRSLMAMSLYFLSEMHILLLLGGSWVFLERSTYGLTKSSAPLFIHKANQTLFSNPAVIVMFCWPRIVCSVCKIMTKAWSVIYARVICLIIFFLRHL